MLDQFLHHPIDTREELLEAYMVGQRLVKFLSVILPTHMEYSTQADLRARAARERSLEQLAVVTKYIDQIALLIDKQEHEDYISLVINQHQDEKSTKHADYQKREDTYYTDDTDDDGERNSTYLATSNTRGSDSTERLNNISIGNSDVSSCKEQSYGQRDDRRTPLSVTCNRSSQGKQTYQPNAHDSSVVSDSVDVLYDNLNSNSRDSFVREDPISTASHTILRVVSPYRDVQAVAAKVIEEQKSTSTLRENVASNENIFDNVDESFSSNTGSYTGMNSQSEMPTIRSHWVAANRGTNNSSGVPKSAETSFSSVDRSFGSMNRNTTKNTSIHQSPGGSVRSIIRSWPPKQDPPGDPPGVNSNALKSDMTGKVTIAPDTKQFPNSDASFFNSNTVNAPPPPETHNALKTLMTGKVTITPDTKQPPKADASSYNHNADHAPSPETETVTLRYKPMSELQVLAAELDKASPSRVQSNDLKTTSSTRFTTRRDPSIGSQFARFSSTSYSTSSCERSAADESECLPIKKCNMVSPDLSTTKTNGSHIVTATNFPSISISNNDENEGKYSNEHNISLDSIGFPKVKLMVSSQVIEPDTSLEARIMSIASNAAIPHTSNQSQKDVSSERNNTSHFHKGEVSQKSENSERLPFPVQFESRSPTKFTINSQLGNYDTRDLSPESNQTDEAAQNESLFHEAVNNIYGSRQSGPVDLDDSTSTYGSTKPNDEKDTIPAVSRGFASDGLDYVLPLPKNVSSTKNVNPVVGSYAPSAADWSIDEEIETGNRRFTRENSTISIDSTEFSGHPQIGNDADRRFAEFEEPPDNVFGNSTDWTPVWSPHDFDSILTTGTGKGKVTDRSHTSNSSTGRPDLSYEAWDEVWNSASKRSNKSHSLDSRKEIIAKGNGVQKGEYCTDRTSSTGSSSSTSRSRDPQDVSSAGKPLGLLDPFSSPNPIEAPFLRDDKESPLMIDSMTEQRLRLPINVNRNASKGPSNSLSLPSHNVGLYGSLKGFQSLDCIIPYDHDHEDQNVDNSRGNILFCRSRAATAPHNRSPNEDDWEESSLLMVESQKDDPRFKSCVRCLLK